MLCHATWLLQACGGRELRMCLPQVRRFARYVLGEGIAKRESNLAAEVAAATGQA